MNRLKLTIATADYGPFSRFSLGIQHNWLMLGHHEIFARFTFNRERDVGETRRGGGQGGDVGCQIRPAA
jgi:4,5-dihydroxyphthalate decarboxylase